jgi:hypothetical protein
VKKAMEHTELLELNNNQDIKVLSVFGGHF